MPHEATLIATLAAAFGLAMIFGFVAVKLKMPPLVGYLFAGIAIGPYTRGFVGDVGLAGQLAEVGVILLMFGVGLHFSIEDLGEVRGLVLPGALLQMAFSTALGFVVAKLWGWSVTASLILGISLCVSSTVVLLRALETRSMLATFEGRLAVAWLIVQDLAMVIVLVLLPPLAAPHAGGPGIVQVVLVTLAKVAAFIVLMFVAGRRVLPRILWVVARTGSRELFTLCVIAAAVGVGFGAARLFGVSFALGAFFAGMMMRESALSHRAAQESLPLQDAFAVLFFVSVGMLFDPMVLVRQPWSVAAVTAVIMLGGPAAAMAVIALGRYPLRTALTVGAGLAQIGEFSFIVAGLGVSIGALPPEGRNVILGGALVSIALNPLVFAGAERLARTKGRPMHTATDSLAELPMSVDSAVLTGHTVIVGYGRVGRRIAAALSERRLPFVVVERNRELVERLRATGVAAVCGDGTEADALIQGHVARARMLVLATPDNVEDRNMIRIARMLNPRIEVVIRTHSEEEAALLGQEHLGEVFVGERELATGMTRHIMQRLSEPGDRTEG